MKTYILSLILSTLLFQFCNAQWEVKEPFEFRMGQGLPNFFHKVNNNQPLNIGLIGDSSTEPAFSWAFQFVDRLQEHYNLDSINVFNAAVSGTTSKYGVFICDKRLLDQVENLDLVFISFSGNDWALDNPEIARSMEGIIRKIWTRNPNTDICLYYVSGLYHMPLLDAGELPRPISVHDSIASYYGIPAVFTGFGAISASHSDTVLWSGTVANESLGTDSEGNYLFTNDGIHATTYGHSIYADVVYRSLLSIDQIDQELSHELRPSLMPDNYLHAKAIHPEPSLNHGMELVSSPGQYDFLDHRINQGLQFLISENSTEYYEFSFEGSQFGFSIYVDPGVGTFTIEIDGLQRNYSAFDSFCAYWRDEVIFENLTPGRHTVKIYATEGYTRSEKRNILETFYQPSFDNSMQQYDRNDFILSEILLLEEEHISTITEHETWEMHIYPNPASDAIQINTNRDDLENSSYQIIDMKGSMVLHGQLLTNTIDISDLDKGVYIIQVDAREHLITKKIIIE